VCSSNGLKRELLGFGTWIVSVRIASSLPIARRFAPLLARKMPFVVSKPMRAGDDGVVMSYATVPPVPVAMRKPRLKVTSLKPSAPLSNDMIRPTRWTFEAFETS